MSLLQNRYKVLFRLALPNIKADIREGEYIEESLNCVT